MNIRARMEFIGVMFMLGPLLYYNTVVMAQAAYGDLSRNIGIFYILLLFSVAQTVLLIIYDFFYISKPQRLEASVSARAKLEDIEAKMKAAKGRYLFNAFLIACALAEASALYGAVLVFFGIPKLYLLWFLIIGLVGLLYVLLRMRFCWVKLYLN